MPETSTHPADDRSKLTFMWILIVLFLIALPMMFVHPGITILLLWVGLVVIGAGAAIHGLFHHRTSG